MDTLSACSKVIYYRRGIRYIIAMQSVVFGPVPSRRLGFSLGVDLIPRKYCSFDCIYCQLGSSGKVDVERRSFLDPASVVEQVLRAARDASKVDHITLSGSGEPTLNRDIGWIIAKLKQEVPLPVAVITNGSLLHLPEVRKDLLRADVVLPSLDAADAATFNKINRPHKSLSLSELLEGLKAFRREYRGKVWLEVMLIRNINNSRQHIEMLRQIIDGIAFDRVQLNTVARPPAEKTAKAVRSAELLSTAQFLGNRCEVIAGGPEKKATAKVSRHWEESLLAILKRRSLSVEDIVALTGASAYRAREELEKLMKERKVEAVTLGGRRFYVAGEEEGSEGAK